jgi:hypothetical protein
MFTNEHNRKFREILIFFSTAFGSSESNKNFVLGKIKKYLLEARLRFQCSR